MLTELPLASQTSLVAAGLFFLVGLLTGVWKFHHIHHRAEATAPTYVDIAHRASLLYAFACLLIERFVGLSQWSDSVELAAVMAQIVFFAAAVASYVIHGLLQDTDNQLKKPHRLGTMVVPPLMMTAFMGALITGEVGGFVVLLMGCWA